MRFVKYLLAALVFAPPALAQLATNPGVLPPAVVTTDSCAVWIDRFHIDDLECPIVNVKRFGAVVDGATDDTTALNAGIAALNAGTVRHLFIPGTLAISSSIALTTVTCDYCAVIGIDGVSEIRRLTTGGGTNGNFFTIGATGDPAIGFNIDGLRFTNANTPTVSHFVIDIIWANSASYSNLRFGKAGNGQDDSVAGLLRIQRGGNLTFINWQGGITKGLATPAHVYMTNAAVITLRNWNFLGTGDAKAANATGKLVHLFADEDKSVDTVVFDNVQMQSFGTIGNSTTADGKPYGLYAEMQAGTNGGVKNIWVVNSVFDHTTVKAVYFESEATNTGTSRVFIISNSRFDTDAGDGIHINNAAGTVQNGLDISHNTVMVTDGTAIKLEGAGLAGALVIANKILDDEITSIKPSAISIAASDFTVDLNTVDGNNTNIPNFTSCIELTNVASTNFVIGAGNNCENLADGFRYVSEPGWTTYSPNRVILRRNNLRCLDESQWSCYSDSFYGNGLNNIWSAQEGSDAETSIGLVVDGDAGQVALTSGNDAAASMAVNGAQLTPGNRNIKANRGGVSIKARIKLSALTQVAVNFCLTDNSALEMPATQSGTTLTTNASDAVCWLYDSASTNDNWYKVGVKADVDTTHVDSGIPPVADTFEELRIDLTVAGTALFYRNGAFVGPIMSNAITPTVALTPSLQIFAREAVSKVLTGDWVSLSQEAQ